jgi:hypothetical protein
MVGTIFALLCVAVVLAGLGQCMTSRLRTRYRRIRCVIRTRTLISDDGATARKNAVARSWRRWRGLRFLTCWAACTAVLGMGACFVPLPFCCFCGILSVPAGLALALNILPSEPPLE